MRESRIRTERTVEGLRIDVPRRRPWWRVLLPVWAGVILALGTVGVASGDRPAADAGAAAFLVVWFAIAASIVALSLWALLYREELLLDARALTQIRRLGPIRLTRSYARDRVEDLRVGPASVSPMDPRSGFVMLGIGAGTVAFDYGDRTHRIADVDEAEAKRVVAALAAEGLGASRG